MIISPTLLQLAGAALLTTPVLAKYTLTDRFDNTNFFSSFSFFNESDPTHGFVKYVDGATANQLGLAGYAHNSIYLGVDHENITTDGRLSTRVESHKNWTTGLFIADIRHMPAGMANSSTSGCGLWPAFWTVSTKGWPDYGEIDIIEGVNSQTKNFMVLHTNETCKVSNTGAMANTKVLAEDCIGSVGCKQQAASPRTFGANFNANGGGVYAMEWTEENIAVWFFPRSSAMANALTAKGRNSTASPDPETFGRPIARFASGGQFGGCDIKNRFKEHVLVINTSMCGDWAGLPEIWGEDETCKALANTCNEFVGANPEAFKEAYWLINEIKVYQDEERVGGGNGTVERAPVYRRGRGRR